MSSVTCVSQNPFIAYIGFSGASSTLTLTVLSSHDTRALYLLTATTVALAVLNELAFSGMCSDVVGTRAEKSCLSCRGLVHLYIGTQALAMFSGVCISGSRWLAHSSEGDAATRARELEEARADGDLHPILLSLEEKKRETQHVFACACFVAWLYMEVAKSDYLG